MDYRWWLNHIFGISLKAKANPQAAKLAESVPPSDALRFITRVFNNCVVDLAPFDSHQVAEGLIFIAAGGESDWMVYLYDPIIDWDIGKFLRKIGGM